MQKMRNESSNLLVALPVITLLLAFLSIGISCGIAWESGHIPPWPPVSMCGMYPPERYIFSLGLSSVSMLLGCLLLVNHVRTEQLFIKQSGSPVPVTLSGTQLGVGMSSALSLALMATVPVSEFPVPHVLFAAAFFSLLFIFQVLNTWTRFRAVYTSTTGWHSRWTVAKEAWMVFWMLSTLAGFVLWQTTGKSFPQYIAIASAMLHFVPYIHELRDTSVRIEVKGSREEEETIACLKDAERVSQKLHRLRNAPLMIAFVVFLVVCGGLAFVIYHLQMDTDDEMPPKSTQTSQGNRSA